MTHHPTLLRTARRLASRGVLATATAALALATVPALSTTAHADGGDCDPGAYCLWADADFQGAKFTVTGEGTVRFEGAAAWFNDQASSAKNNTGKWVGVYDNITPDRIISCFPPNTQLQNFRDSKLGDANDKASAVVVAATEQGACGVATPATSRINCGDSASNSSVPAAVGSGWAAGSDSAGSDLAIALFNMAVDAYRSKAQRAETVHKLIDAAVKARPGLNVMVYDVKHDPDTADPNKPRWIDQLTGVHDAGDILYCNPWDGTIHTYRIWTFEGGEFTNQSDGGWLNWGFYGRFSRLNPDGSDNPDHGSRVRFYPPANGSPRSANGIGPAFGTGADGGNGGGGTSGNGGNGGGGSVPSGTSNRPAHGQVAQLSAANGLVVDLAGSSTSPGTKVQAWGGNGSAAQKWAFWDKGNGNWLIETNFRGGMVIDRDVNSNRTGLWHVADGATNQLWQFVDAGGGYAQIRNTRDGACLTADSAGQALAVQSCDGGSHQRFQLG
ncbi:RICIN domain-containing protein [Kitasatospora sp. NPDC096077]|uniref:RICIN domain-containing protein n=1 Tax=Kitasatospora sp. NPDC096077 TaxID=3155544 RepID=UPI00331DBB61